GGPAVAATRPHPVRAPAGGGQSTRGPRAGGHAEPRRSVSQARRREGVMSGHRIAAITRRLLQGFRRDRRTLALLFVAPLVILGLLGYMLRNSSTPAVGVANEDGGPLGAVVASALDQSTKITTTTIAASDGDAKLKDGSIVAYIVFPSDFSQRAQSGVSAAPVPLGGSQPSAAAQAAPALQPALAA